MSKTSYYHHIPIIMNSGGFFRYSNFNLWPEMETVWKRLQPFGAAGGDDCCKEKAIELATILSEGRWTHDFPIMVDAARQLGLKVSTNMPQMVYQLMDLYPQAGTGRPSLLYVPLRRPTKDQGEAPKTALTARTS